MNIIYITDSQDKFNHFKENIPKLRIYKQLHKLISLAQVSKIDMLFIDRDKIDKETDVFTEFKKAYPETKIIIVSEPEYSLFSAGLIHSSIQEYIAYNANALTIKRLINNYIETKENTQKNIYIETMPNFRLFLNGEEIKIGSKKSKEMLAYFVDNNGVPLGRTQIIKALWPETYCENYDLLRITYARLKKALEQYGISDLVKRQNGLRYIDTNLYTSDISRLTDSDSQMLEKYNGRYLEEYPNWNSNTKKTIERIIARYEISKQN